MQQVSFPQAQPQQGLMQQGQSQQDYIQQPYTPGTASHVDHDDDYCKSYAVLVEELNKLLKSLEAGGSTPELQLEIQNQTRAAVSGCTLFSNGQLASCLKGILHSAALCMLQCLGLAVALSCKLPQTFALLNIPNKEQWKLSLVANTLWAHQYMLESLVCHCVLQRDTSQSSLQWKLCMICICCCS